MHFTAKSNGASWRHPCFAAVLAMAIGLGSGSALAGTAPHQLDIVSQVPRFQAFYKGASAKPLNEAARWALWEKLDGLAAVPPTPQGKASARRMLKTAWPKYQALTPSLPALAVEAKAAARTEFARLNTLFKTGATPIHSRVALFVGLYSGNAFTVPAMGGQPSTVYYPLEYKKPGLVFAHELTHSLNFQLAHVRHGYGAPIGQVIFQEGLAMRAAQKIMPGHGARTYLTMGKAQYGRCKAREAAIVKEIEPDLAKSGAAIVNKYVFGTGNTGMHREAYCAGWYVVGHMLKSGMTFPELARIPEDKMVAAVRKAIQAM